MYIISAHFSETTAVVKVTVDFSEQRPVSLTTPTLAFVKSLAIPELSFQCKNHIMPVFTFTCSSLYLEHYSNPLLQPTRPWTFQPCPPFPSVPLRPPHPSLHSSGGLILEQQSFSSALQRAGAMESFSACMSLLLGQRTFPDHISIILFSNLHRKCLKFYYIFPSLFIFLKKLYPETLTPFCRNGKLPEKKPIIFFLPLCLVHSIYSPPCPYLPF